MGISCQQNGHWAATNHLSIVCGRAVAGRDCALIRQLANWEHIPVYHHSVDATEKKTWSRWVRGVDKKAIASGSQRRRQSVRLRGYQALEQPTNQRLEFCSSYAVLISTYYHSADCFDGSSMLKVYDRCAK